MNISTTRPSVVVTDESGNALGTESNPLETKERSTDEILTDILMELRTMNEHLLAVRAAF